MHHIQYIEKQQQISHFVVFTVVRDPMERFLSGVQKVMRCNQLFRQACLKATATATLQCAIHDIKATKYRHDVHLLPMASHLRVFDQYDIWTSVFYMRDSFGELLQYLGSSVGRHTYDRTQIQYATSQVLAEMTVEKGCTKDMIRDICELYAVDVAMMQTLGFPTPYCKM